MPNDITKRCVEPDCKETFVLTAGEVSFFEQKGWKLPRRCKKCRNRKRSESSSPFGDFARKSRYQTFYGTGKDTEKNKGRVL